MLLGYIKKRKYYVDLNVDYSAERNSFPNDISRLYNFMYSNPL